MRILFTGASSFTGHWFVRQLAAAGHHVVATYQGAPEDYEGVRAMRVDGVGDEVEQVFSCSFGSDRFLELANASGGWDLLCHHAADVTDYKSETFDYARALGRNTRELPRILEALGERGCSRVLLTGSVFEGGEGAGSDGLPAFSPYGLSKEMTASAFRYFAARAGMRLGKFVIPNTFGPLEEPRFTAYLVRSWAAGKTARVNTPDYVRDNIHVDLLAKAYAAYAASLPESPGFDCFNPSGYVETQGRFAERFAAEMRPRLGLECGLELATQTEFPEPRMRVNTDPVDGTAVNWSETESWDALADYYAPQVSQQTSGGAANHG